MLITEIKPLLYTGFSARLSGFGPRAVGLRSMVIQDRHCYV
jgi:hypothetical protein